MSKKTLKFSPRTVEVIKNFSTINPSLLFRKGSILRTRNSGNNLYGVARVSETFDTEFAIYDLARFLGILSTFTDPVIDLGDKKCFIEEGTRKLAYTFCNPEDIVTAPDSDMKVPKPFITMALTRDDLQNVLKAQAVLNLPEFFIEGKDGKILLETSSSETKVVDHYSMEIGKTDLTFKVVVKSELLTKIIAEDYSLEISRNKNDGIIALRGKDVDYFIAPEDNSSYV